MVINYTTPAVAMPIKVPLVLQPKFLYIR